MSTSDGGLPRRGLAAPDWVQTRLGDPHLRIVDASWYLPTEGRDPRAEFAASHIPGAVFFPIDTIADQASPLPHMLPTAGAFADAVGRLGIGNDDRVVVYDGAGLFSAARVWWTFRVFGHDDVLVLDGGFPRWIAENRPVESGEPAPKSRSFRATLRPERVRALDQMRSTTAQVVDARSRGRFEGTTPEPRPGVRSGHIPNSKNLPYADLITDGRLEAPEALQAIFRAAGIDVTAPVNATCGSGVTAPIIALALYTLGYDEAAVYDGSWTEWGGRDDTDIVGPGASRSKERDLG